jgi:3-oxoacyl-[acyl-carrier-protein] synthase-3
MTMELLLPAIEGLRLRASGAARPSEVAPGAVPGRLTNAEAYQLLLGSDWKAELERRGFNWAVPRNRWGIVAREWGARPGEAPGCSVFELAAAAARSAARAAGWEPHSIGLLVLATHDPDPSIAERVRAELGLGGEALQLADHTGGLGAWVQALARMTAVGGPRRALVVGADLLSPALRSEDLASALIHGDAAAALAVEASDEPGGGLEGAGSGRLDGVGADPLCGAQGHPLARPNPAQLEAVRAAWERAVGGVENLPSAAAFLPLGVTAEQVRAIGERVGYGPGRTKSSLVEHGCVGAASIPLTVHEWLCDSERAGADLNVVNVDLVAAGHDGSWAWMRLKLGDETEPDSAMVPTD